MIHKLTVVEIMLLRVENIDILALILPKAGVQNVIHATRKQTKS